MHEFTRLEENPRAVGRGGVQHSAGGGIGFRRDGTCDDSQGGGRSNGTLKQSEGKPRRENRKGKRRFLRLQQTRHRAFVSGYPVRVDLHNGIGRGKTARC